VAPSFASLDDVEGERLPSQLPPVVDAHVHLFPDRLFEAVWRWFDEHAWKVRYRLHSPEAVAFLRARGVKHIVGLSYAHRPGMARLLNQYMAEQCAVHPAVTGAATVFPGEPEAGAILDEAFAAGLKLVKMHCHVQAVAPDDPAMDEVYRACVRADRPLVIHAGRGPHSAHYRVDPQALCSVDRLERVLRAHPRLTVVVPHLGYDEFDAYERLLERYDRLWLDTTMAVAGYFVPCPERLLRTHPERILYGTDFPNLPYAWDREIKKLIDLRLPEADLAAVLGGNARALFSIT
jgi:uncharacterized protein